MEPTADRRSLRLRWTPLPTTSACIVPPLLILVGLVGIVVPVLPGLLVVLAGVLLWALMEGTGLAWGIFVASAARRRRRLRPAVPPARPPDARAGCAVLDPGPGRAVRDRRVLRHPRGRRDRRLRPRHLRRRGRAAAGDRSQAWVRTKHALVAVLHSIGIELAAGLAIAAPVRRGARRVLTRGPRVVTSCSGGAPSARRAGP